MSTISKERAQEIFLGNGPEPTALEERELARIALASLEAEPVAIIDQANLDYLKSGSDADVWPASRTEMGDVLLYRAAPPASVENTKLERKAAILDALYEKYNIESLDDFVEWKRNHIAELEAAPPAPVGKGEAAVMPDYPGYVMTQRECFEAGKKAGLAEAGNSPVIPDGWVMLPAEPTQAMMNAWLSEVANWRGHAAGYRAMIAAAPQQDVKSVIEMGMTRYGDAMQKLAGGGD